MVVNTSTTEELKSCIYSFVAFNHLSLGVAIRHLREAKGITLEVLGRRCGISHAGLSKIERGETKEPAFETIVKVAKALNVPIDQLVQLAEGNEASTPDADTIEVEAEKALEFLSKFIRRNRK
jgi:transcriptional regulator with XRE-family HTH domain